ncbi:MFS transporter [Rhodococcus sp. (in: high G+C Gram-positive bacteria)]|uniref:MFS transporter n=1 Tax=Rhodococcus sp. TaxID=1831 RepID=UPI00258F3CA5|nr:MFS transporter [Rhodococcus sp. (in: high G+C Gram-positive bacteria)]MCX6474182.1 MFS transporter [Rhodococcus sp. (in: high G+C Gram-positive bacteria)]
MNRIANSAPERNSLRLFLIRDYRLLFSAQIIALFGTGLATVALGLLAYELAGPSAGAVLATALTIKMSLYVVIAPLAAAYVDRLPRRAFLVALDAIRAAVVIALPFVSEIWHIYVLVGVLQAASAAFTPTFQAVIPDIVTDEADFTRALSASQVAYTMESLLSPVLAAVALSFMTFNLLFVATSVGFAVSALLVLATRIPNARRSTHRKAWDRIASGVQIFVTTPRLRGIMALNLVVAAAGSIVVVNTVNYVRDELGGTQSDVAWMLAASGTGTLMTALLLPRVLDRTAERTVMTAGSVVLVFSAGAAAALAVVGVFTWMLTAAVWALVGAGMAMIVTPTGKVLRRSVDPAGIPEVFAAQFSLSHLAWLVTYPIAGWVGSSAGFAVTWSILAALAAVGAVAGFALWPRETVAELPVQAAYETTRGECTLAATQCACARPV